MLSLLQHTALALCLHCAEISWLLPSSVLTLVTTMGLKFGQFKLAAAMARQWRGRQTRGNWARGHGAMDGGPVVLVTPLHHTRAGAYLRGAATIWLSVTMRQLATKYIIWYPTISLSVYLHICSCLLCLKCTEFVILCLYNSTNRVYIIHQIKSK